MLATHNILTTIKQKASFVKKKNNNVQIVHRFYYENQTNKNKSIRDSR